ncbi:glycosyltransferase family 25 protein [Hypoxylon sp. FL1284]|nr:glycosyltransferase family 25 protein [Hypoxylon sp. FL1284]
MGEPHPRKKGQSGRFSVPEALATAENVQPLRHKRVMPPFRRALTILCVFAPLIYIYWHQFAIPSSLDRLLRGASTASEDVFNNTLGVSYRSPSIDTASATIDSTDTAAKMQFSKILVINLPSRTDRRDAMVLAGAVSNLSLSWVDGVDGAPAADGTKKGHSAGARGSWRSHMSALQRVVDEGLGSALVVEDDIDWDVRLKPQLRGLAAASRAWLDESGLADAGGDDDVRSAYGGGWDVQWLGHCGAALPGLRDPPVAPPTVIAMPGDDTVPAPQHLKPHPFAPRDRLGAEYPPHTRVVHASAGNVCTLAYAVSRRGARRLLSEFGARYDAQWDIVLQKWCEGGSGSTPDRAAARPVCLTVQPPLFSHYYPKGGGGSDIQGQGGGYARGTGTPYVRLSVRQNMRQLVTGAPFGDMVDQLPDDGDPIWK